MRDADKLYVSLPSQLLESVEESSEKLLHGVPQSEVPIPRRLLSSSFGRDTDVVVVSSSFTRHDDLSSPRPFTSVERRNESSGTGSHSFMEQSSQKLSMPSGGMDRRQEKRKNIVRIFKSTKEYEAFNAERPRHMRRLSEPSTPDPTDHCSKRIWETRFHVFKASVIRWSANISDSELCFFCFLQRLVCVAGSSKDTSPVPVCVPPHFAQLFVGSSAMKRTVGNLRRKGTPFA